MSTSFSNGVFSRNPLSLRGFLKEAVFVAAEDIMVRGCANRAELCQPGDVFIPQHSATGDEHDKVDEAIRRGAVGIVAERLLPVSIPQCLVEDTAQVYGQICQALAGNPTRRMLTIGVLGTHGKTTTSLFVAAMLKRLGGAVAYYTSLGASDSTSCDRTAVRAPAARKLAKWLEQSDQAGAPAAIMELTPAMIRNQAIAGVEFDLLIVTGMRPSQLGSGLNGRALGEMVGRVAQGMKGHGVILYNADDASAAQWAEASDFACVSYGIDAARDVRAKRLSRHGREQQLLVSAGNLLMPLTLKIPGDHVARAAMAAIATSWLLDFSVPEAIAGVESLESIPGRMQWLSQAVEVPVVIDQGELPDRVAVGLHAMRQHHFGPTTVVMDLSTRLDARWRQRLGEVLDRGAERIVLSASGLSAEAAQSVAMDLLGGVRRPGRVQVIPDRVAAIRWAVETTSTGCILLAGCGANPYLSRDGAAVCDEAVARAAVSDKNFSALSTPVLSIFPPSAPTAFFSH